MNRPGLLEGLVRPGFGVVELAWILMPGYDAVAFEFYRREPPELAVTAFAVVPYLEVPEDRVGEVDAGVPFLPVEQLDLHP